MATSGGSTRGRRSDLVSGPGGSRDPPWAGRDARARRAHGEAVRRAVRSHGGNVPARFRVRSREPRNLWRDALKLRLRDRHRGFEQVVPGTV